jgi:uncharacterized protein YciI
MPEKSKAPRLKDVPLNLQPYFLCLLRTGPQWDVPQGEEDLMPLQLAFLRRQTELGNFLITGPVLGRNPKLKNELTGITVIRAENLQAAQALAHQDPAVQSGRLVAEVRPIFLPSLGGVRVQY